MQATHCGAHRSPGQAPRSVRYLHSEHHKATRKRTWPHQSSSTATPGSTTRSRSRSRTGTPASTCSASPRWRATSSLARTTANALAVCEYIGAAGTPVTPGCAGPLLRPALDARQVHGESGLGGAVLPPAAASPAPGHAIDYITETVRAAPGQITLVATGPLTNIALAVKREPRLADWVREFVIMGGSAGRGNVTPAAEYNIWADPEAAAAVFRAGWTVVSAGAGRDAADRGHRRRCSSGCAAWDRSAPSCCCPPWTSTSPSANPRARRRRPAGPAPPVHDVCAVAWVAQPGLFGLVPAWVQVETAGQLTAGMTVTDFEAPGLEAPGGRRRQRPGGDVHRRGRLLGADPRRLPAGRAGHGALTRAFSGRR